MSALFYCSNATEVFYKVYNHTSEHGEIVESRIGKTKHLTDVTIVLLHPYHGLCLDKTRNLSLKYMIGEIEWYLSGSNKVADIGKYAKMWYSLTDDGETVNSAYGYRIFHKFGFDQLQYCIDKLKANPHDRQAVIHIKEADNKPTKDTPCTCLIQFTVFKGKLNAHTYMRSNDIWLGLPYDMAFFTSLLHIVSNATGIPVGEYVHTVGDLHLYEKHWNKDVSYTVLKDEYKLDYTTLTDAHKKAILSEKCPSTKFPALTHLWRLNHGYD